MRSLRDAGRARRRTTAVFPLIALAVLGGCAGSSVARSTTLGTSSNLGTSSTRAPTGRTMEL
jgi:hypothetical protein